MQTGSWTRRGALAALASAPACSAWADHAVEQTNAPSIFAGTSFADNMVAREFAAPPPGLTLPTRNSISGPKGSPNSIDGYRGKVILLSLWAEWCVPCMMEMPIFNILIQRYSTDKFQIVPVMSGTNYTYPGEAKAILSKIKADTLPLIMDNSPKADALARALAKSDKDDSFSLPCNLLIDAHGVIRGRAMGGAIFKNDNHTYSAWGSADGVAFAKALSNGDISWR